MNKFSQKVFGDLEVKRGLNVINGDGSICLNGTLIFRNDLADTITEVRTAQTADREIDLPDESTLLIGTDTTDTLTNKTIIDSSNNITANRLRTVSGDVTIGTAIAPTIGQALVATSATEAAWQTVPDQGEDNTASNVGTGGVGLFDSKVGVDLQFKNINSGSNKVSITNDVANKEVDIDVNEGNLDINNIGGSPLDVANGGTGVATLTAGNVLVGDGINDVQTLKTAPSGDFVGTTDTQSLTNKTITDSSNTVVANQLRTTTGTVTVDTAVAPTIGQALVATSATEAAWQTVPDQGEDNTASNVGTGGVGLFDAKVGCGSSI